MSNQIQITVFASIRINQWAWPRTSQANSRAQPCCRTALGFPGDELMLHCSTPFFGFDSCYALTQHQARRCGPLSSFHDVSAVEVMMRSCEGYIWQMGMSAATTMYNVDANPVVCLAFQHPDQCKVYHQWEWCDHTLVEEECVLACPTSKSSATRSLWPRWTLTNSFLKHVEAWDIEWSPKLLQKLLSSFDIRLWSFPFQDPK